LKNIQVIDGAANCVYDIFAATDDEFSLIFPRGEDIAFIDEVQARCAENSASSRLEEALGKIWQRPIAKCDVQGIHGVLFYELEQKKQYYPTRRDRDAANRDGSRLR